MRLFVFVILCLSLTGCNSIYMKPETLDKSQLVYAPRAGFSMARSVKETMINRGYDVSVGKLVRVSEISGVETYHIPQNAKYAVNVTERREKLRPVWCLFNGFWWWNFNISIINRTNNEEILSWRGRGCQNSSLRKLNDILDELEMKTPPQKPTRKKTQAIQNKNTDLVVLAKKPTQQAK